jgi:hypothetical protein
MIRHWEESNDGCVWCMRGGSAVLADRNFPGCEERGRADRGRAERRRGRTRTQGPPRVRRKETRSNPTRAQLQEPKAHARGERSGPEGPTKERREGKEEERKKDFLLECEVMRK